MGSGGRSARGDHPAAGEGDGLGHGSWTKDLLPSRCLPHFVDFSPIDPRVSLRTADHGLNPVVNLFVYGRLREVTSILLQLILVYGRLQEMTSIILQFFFAP